MTFSGVRKSYTLYVRISSALKARLTREAERRNEAESVVIREALREYFESKGGASHAPAVYPTSRGIDAAFNETSARKTKP